MAMQISRANPFQFMDTGAPAAKAAPPASSAAAPPAPAASAAAPAANDPPSFLANFHSAMASGPSTPAAAPAPPLTSVPAMPAATYTGSRGYFDSSAVDARTAAANSMLTALGRNDLKGYQQAAANFLAACPAGSGLPVWATTVTVDPKGNLINTNCAGIAFDGTVVGDDHMGYAGMMNPVPGTPNIADGTANYLGDVIPRAT
jgi:hypothetical protein